MLHYMFFVISNLIRHKLESLCYKNEMSSIRNGIIHASAKASRKSLVEGNSDFRSTVIRILLLLIAAD